MTQHSFRDMAAQAADLQAALTQLADAQEKNTYDLNSVRTCMDDIQRLMKRVGNDRPVALSSKYMRKYMDELQERVDQLDELLK